MENDFKHKDLISVYETIKKEIRNGRWVGISEDDITHSYDNKTNTTNIIVKFTDRNNHTHICTLKFNPDFRIDWAPEKEVVSIIYRFEGKFEKGLKHRSFAKYLSCFQKETGKYGIHTYKNHFIRYSDFEDINYHFICLIDSLISLIRPLDWFVETFYLSFKRLMDLDQYTHKVFNKIKIEADKSRWNGIESKCFFTEKERCFKNTNLNLLFHFDKIFELQIGIEIFRSKIDSKAIIYIIFGRCLSSYSPYINTTQEIYESLLRLFSKFVEKVKGSIIDRFINASYNRNSVAISLPLEHSFDYFCSILDKFIYTLHNFKFQIPVPVTDNEPSDTIKEVVQLLEKSLNTTFEILPELSEEQEVNERLKRIYVWTEEPSSRVENVGISNCAILLNQDGN